MHKELLDYTNNTKGDVENFNLGVWYEKQNHYSPACGFYLRCADFTRNKNLAYECMIRMFICYRQLSGRDKTCEDLLKKAICICPQKPEAYFFLSKFYESKNWPDSYLFSSLALENCSSYSSDLKLKTEYEAKYMLIFQKALSAWWCGKAKESRSLFQLLKNDHIEELNEIYFNSIEKNITCLGSGPVSTCCVRYDKSKLKKIKLKFKNIENIEKNFSQVYQDMFVLTVLDGKQNGTYLEIGSAHPFYNNNTALLEQLGWNGVGVEIKQELADQYKKERKNKILCKDALRINYEKLISENYQDSIIDYLQLDIEPSKNTFEALISIPFEKYQFRVITYEHDHYVDMTGNYKEKSRRYLSTLGYTLLFNDISPNENSPFEDWWVKEDLIDSKILNKLILIEKQDNVNQVEILFYPKIIDDAVVNLPPA